MSDKPYGFPYYKDGTKQYPPKPAAPKDDQT